MIKKFMAGIITLYQTALSPGRGLFSKRVRVCRFYPSCSEYARISFGKYGFLKAFFMSAKRVSRCNPFCEGGYDPVE